MNEIIELTLHAPEGIIDCRLEPHRNDAGTPFYNVTMLYPHMVNGFSRSEIFCHDLLPNATTGSYFFEEGDKGLHPKIKKLEQQLSAALRNVLKK